MPDEGKDSQGQEFNRFTLTGEWDAFYTALLKLRMINHDLNPNRGLLNQFKKHIERGIVILYNRVKTFSDLAGLLSSIVV